VSAKCFAEMKKKKRMEVNNKRGAVKIDFIFTDVTEAWKCSGMRIVLFTDHFLTGINSQMTCRHMRGVGVRRKI